VSGSWGEVDLAVRVNRLEAQDAHNQHQTKDFPVTNLTRWPTRRAPFLIRTRLAIARSENNPVFLRQPGAKTQSRSVSKSWAVDKT
jgi:hypothetical protein